MTGQAQPWGEGEPPHGWVCGLCGRTISNAPCESSSNGAHLRNLRLTGRWHNTIEEVAWHEEQANREAEAQRRASFSLTLDTTNIAFGNNSQSERNNEVARILTMVAARLYGGEGREGMDLMDHNGNTVGRYEFRRGE